MTLRQRIANFLLSPAYNSLANSTLGRQFLRQGNRNTMPQDWSDLQVTDDQLYTSYMYAAIRNRGNKIAQLAIENLKTDADEKIVQAAKKKDEEIVHPYLELVNNSNSFSNYLFWYMISTYLDLEGIFYLMAVRNARGTRVGEIQEFKLLNPYEVKRVMSKDTLEVAGYTENRKGFIREIPPEMIIEVRDLNPFDWMEPYALADAAKEHQFTLKQASDYTRHAMKGNINAPGVLTTDVILPDEMFQNFKARVNDPSRSGEPLFGNGPGAIKWDDMQTDLNKSALEKITPPNVEALLAVTGMSKTMLGIEQSGVTRETSKVQTELFITNQAMPRLQLIIDALCQDYKTNYPAEYEKNKYYIAIDSPLEADREAEKADVEIRQLSYDLYNNLVNKGYDREIAAKFASGMMPLEDMGEPTNEPVTVDLTPAEGNPPSDNPPPNEQQGHLAVIRNQLDESSRQILRGQESTLKGAINNIQQRLVMAVTNKVTRNAYETVNDIVDEQDRKAAQDDLKVVLQAFLTIVIGLYANSIMLRRRGEFKLLGEFSLDDEVKKYIIETAGNAADSHIDTILNDLLQVVAEAALTGLGQAQLVAAIRQEYIVISKTRAELIARTEANRAFTRAQFEADKQFLAQNELTGRAFKKWQTRSSAPCEFCLVKAAEPPIPFDQPFANLGDTVSANFTHKDGTKVVRKLPINYEVIEAGSLHPRCECAYVLIIEGLT